MWKGKMMLDKPGKDTAPDAPEIELTDEQYAALNDVQEWFARGKDQLYRLFGHAGTGKTFVAKKIGDKIGGAIYAAFTGKATHVLKQNGCKPASTIHSLIYQPKETYDTSGLDPDGSLALIVEAGTIAPDMVKKKCIPLYLYLKERFHDDNEQSRLEWLSSMSGVAEHHIVAFIKKEGGPDWGQKEIEERPRLIIIDECSMVDEEMGTDLLAKGIPMRPDANGADDGEVFAVWKDTFAHSKSGAKINCAYNIVAACLLDKIKLRYDQFAERIVIVWLDDDGKPGEEKELTDNMCVQIRNDWDIGYNFRPSKELFYDSMLARALFNSFHPVRDYLKSNVHDGTPRTHNWLQVYAGAEDTPYTRAVGEIFLLACVRRIMEPGCKFDEMIIFESPQGFDKSQALAVLAVRDEWFCDDMPLDGDTKKVIEQSAGVWIIEAGDLKGMKTADVGHLKTMLSRRFDKSRMAFGHLTENRRRQFVIAGTTNEGKYFKDLTGNRRFWPVKVLRFNLELLKADIGQLWAEAFAKEQAGASIRLAPELWPVAAEIQKERLEHNAYVDDLEEKLGMIDAGRIKSVEVMKLLEISIERRNPPWEKVKAAMEELGL
jgi:predicted P-loop ATPase